MSTHFEKLVYPSKLHSFEKVISTPKSGAAEITFAKTVRFWRWKFVFQRGIRISNGPYYVLIFMFSQLLALMPGQIQTLIPGQLLALMLDQAWASTPDHAWTLMFDQMWALILYQAWAQCLKNTLVKNNLVFRFIEFFCTVFQVLGKKISQKLVFSEKRFT